MRNKPETNARGFKFIKIEDRYGNKIRVQQSSGNLSDIWLFIEEAGALGEDDNDILLTKENVKDIYSFVKHLR